MVPSGLQCPRRCSSISEIQLECALSSQLFETWIKFSLALTSSHMAPAHSGASLFCRMRLPPAVFAGMMGCFEGSLPKRCLALKSPGKAG